MDILNDKIGHLIIKIGIPTLVGMFFMTMLNLTDTYFAGQINDPSALAGLAITFSIYMIINAYVSAINSATGSLVGEQLGRKNIKKAQENLTRSLQLMSITTGILTVIVLFLVEDILKISTKNSNVIYHGLNYIRPIFGSLIIFTISSLTGHMLTVQGQTKRVRNALIIGFLVNIVLDYTFVRYFNLGTFGLALATIFVQLIQFSYIINYFLKSELGKGYISQLKIDFRKLSIRSQKTLRILKLALPVFISTSLVGVGSLAINRLADQLASSAGNVAIGVGFRIEQIFIITVAGAMSSAIMAIASQNYGAGNYHRIFKLYKTAILYGLYALIPSALFMYFFGEIIAKVFLPNDQEGLKETIRYLKIESLVLPTYAILFISTSLLLALQKPLFSMFFNLSRQLVVPIIGYPIMINILSAWTNNESITHLWWSIVANNYVHSIIVFIITLKFLRKLIEQKEIKIS